MLDYGIGIDEVNPRRRKTVIWSARSIPRNQSDIRWRRATPAAESLVLADIRDRDVPRADSAIAPGGEAPADVENVHRRKVGKQCNEAGPAPPPKPCGHGCRVLMVSHPRHDFGA